MNTPTLRSSDTSRSLRALLPSLRSGTHGFGGDDAPSPHNLKLRAMLQYKGLRLAAGTQVDDGGDIAPALDRVVPFPPLLHGSERAQALCHAIEQWADGSLQPLALQLQQPSGPPSVERLQALERHLAHASALLADTSFVLGEQPSVADFALFGPLAFLLQAEVGREQVQARPRLERFVERMAALERRALGWRRASDTLECAA